MPLAPPAGPTCTPSEEDAPCRPAHVPSPGWAGGARRGDLTSCSQRRGRQKSMKDLMGSPVAGNAEGSWRLPWAPGCKAGAGCGRPAHQVLADVLGSLRREEAERWRRSPVEKEAVLQGRRGEREPTSQRHRVNRASPWRQGCGQGPLCLRDPESHQEQRKASAVWKTTTLRRSHAEVSVSVQ